MPLAPKIIIATSNEYKLKEIKEIFNAFEIVGLTKDYKAPEEIGHTFCENALIKAKSIEHLGEIVLADDSGIEVQALLGLPGIYSARYSGGDDYQNNIKLLEELKHHANRKARFVCCMVAIVNKKTISAEGLLEGAIAFEPKGKNGFGYDPIFIPSGFNQTLAELGSDIKNKISHRKKALEQIRKKIMENLK
ncbi:RdgB/HAM1 family non-canonical purine NTP pyrophosphatase [Desulfurella sp.]|uniref:RdgB/HAM1 family non-canonical purine NTP pyrophosphatase n=1 Tax=Desulfurella sp. TaxID=1962857 RepID=UPI003D13994F